MSAVRYPFEVHFNPETRVFDVHLDGCFVGSHKGRGGADKIGNAALKSKADVAKHAASTSQASPAIA
jgi:hypothetical protein